MSTSTNSHEHTEAEQAALRLLQADIPDTERPYLEIAERTGLTEEAVLDLLRRLKDRGVVRRFGATLRHQQAGYGANAMVAWFVEQERDLNEVGAIMANRPEISHCYQRVNCYAWPYNLYTMVHARSREDCLDVVEQLARIAQVPQYDILFSRKELKKTSMAYF
ncbi:siroheme decarboxylase subunit beta [Desulfonatronum lacustre]|uniref:siroheme decarboxylase subunit beta n=1 Tax=Desulfonatronum lacustre TaxID=66849 RepID=UPI00048E3919|nr:winged helix-turn-helix transcriptional regulator [Desulfonatronum lacustre]SMP39140.1 DNA-binding transcriptional regulator, Lrp family [Desulfonatronum zhilinae]